jgi:peptidoglycan-N-acetylglucosamine deacetylase
MYWVKTPSIIKPLGKDFLWNVRTDAKEIYLTFDDGPTPGVTEQVLGLLQQHNAKATFFCLGKNVEAHPELYQQIIREGHSIGNHSYSHPDGWKTCTFSYVKNVLQASTAIESNLFRPPYGHITFSQASLLRKKFQIVMWDVLSGDFDPGITKEKCLDNVLKNATKGSVVVLHDSLKAKERMLYALEGGLKKLGEDGYGFCGVPVVNV